MLQNYLKIALRNLWKYKGYTFINVFGLAVGMACCLLILLFVQDELAYDRFHKHAERIYRVVRELTSETGTTGAAVTASGFGPALVQDYPGVEAAVRLRLDRDRPTVRYGELQFQEERFYFADSNFFQVFTHPMRRGDATTALVEPFTIVLTASTARRYFGDAEAAVGQVLDVGRTQYRVTGVVDDVPGSAHLHFDFLASMPSLRALDAGTFSGADAWLGNSDYTYVLLREGQPAAALEAQLPGFVDRHMGTPYPDLPWKTALHLQPLTRIHLHSHLAGEAEPNSDVTYVYLFSAIALFILLLAGINYMNLSTARSARRAREVGVRKALGARRRHLAGQFLGESVLMAALGYVLAVVLVEMALPLFNTVSGKALAVAEWTEVRVLVAFAGLALGVGVAAGAYPAFILSAFRPVTVLKASFRTGPSGASFRKGLVVFQFAVALVLMAATVVVQEQLAFLQGKKLGFDKEQIVVLPVRSQAIAGQIAAVQAELARLPGVARVATSLSVPPNRSGSVIDGWPVAAEGHVGEQIMRGLVVGFGFVEAYGMEIAAGRSFSEAYPTDSASAFLLNEAAVRQLGWKDPIGKRCTWYGGPRIAKEGVVVGVVKDFHFESLHQPIEPLVMQVRPDWFRFVSVRLRTGDARPTVAAIEALWGRFDPAQPFEYTFLDDDYDALYRSEARLGQVVGYFSVLAVLVACLGLFGLAAFTAEQRTKEIGIRKVMGASVAGLVALLTKGFLQLVLGAFVLSAPVAYLATQWWLSNFAYRVDVGPRLFVLVGALTLLITLSTVSYQALKAALTDPVKNLRYE